MLHNGVLVISTPVTVITSTTITGLPLVSIHPREEHEGQKFDGAESSEQPVEVVQVRAVEVVGEPARPALGRGLVNDGDEQAAEEVPDAEDAEEQGQPEAARRVRYLVDGGGELGETGRWSAGETPGGGRQNAESNAGGLERKLDMHRRMGIIRLVFAACTIARKDCLHRQSGPLV
jgi:hypothetical protein